jgi:hypothetical protein
MESGDFAQKYAKVPLPRPEPEIAIPQLSSNWAPIFDSKVITGINPVGKNRVEAHYNQQSSRASHLPGTPDTPPL